MLPDGCWHACKLRTDQLVVLAVTFEKNRIRCRKWKAIRYVARTVLRSRQDRKESVYSHILSQTQSDERRVAPIIGMQTALVCARLGQIIWWRGKPLRTVLFLDLSGDRYWERGRIRTVTSGHLGNSYQPRNTVMKCSVCILVLCSLALFVSAEEAHEAPEAPTPTQSPYCRKYFRAARFGISLWYPLSTQRKPLVCHKQNRKATL